MSDQIEYNNYKYVYQVVIINPRDFSKEVVSWLLSLEEAIKIANHFYSIENYNVQINRFPLNVIGLWGDCLCDNFEVIYSIKA